MIGNEDIWKHLQEIVGADIIVTESPKSVEQQEQALFLELVETIETAWNKDHQLYEELGIDIAGFSQYLYHAIETLVILKYGAIKAEIFWWYVLDRLDEEGNILGLEDENGKIYHFKTHKQFYKFFKNFK
jgi:hypothetical protein